METITITLTVEELMLMPGEGVMRILTKANPPADFLKACHDHENRPHHGKGRWPVNNHIRQLIAKAQS